MKDCISCPNCYRYKTIGIMCSIKGHVTTPFDTNCLEWGKEKQETKQENMIQFPELDNFFGEGE